MALIIAARSAQDVKELEFVFNIVDTMVNTSGVIDGFATVATHVFDVAPMPINSVVIGGSLVTDTAVTGSTAYNVSVGDASSATRYLGATDKTTAASTALVPTGFRTAVTTGIRLTVAPTVATATAGKLTLRVMYVTDGQADYAL
jgi:hypothetical protein